MKKTVLRIVSLIIMCSMCVASFCSCSGIVLSTSDNSTDASSNAPRIDPLDLVSTKTAPAAMISTYFGSDTLRVALKSGVSDPSPLFCRDRGTSEQLSYARLVDTDRAGEIVYKGIGGEQRIYDSVSYTYYGLSDIAVTKNADGTATYDIKLREDVFFSDGVNLTADDVIFTMYVLLDSTYDGYSRLGTLDIVGLDKYYAGMRSLGEMIFEAQNKKIVPSGVSEVDRQRFLDKFASARSKYISELVGCVTEKYKDERSRYLWGGAWADQLGGSFGKLDVAYCMVVLGYAEWEKDIGGEYTGALVTSRGARYDCKERYPVADELYELLVSDYPTIEELDGSCEYDIDLHSVLKETFGSSYQYFFGVEYGDLSSATNISGIKKTGMYSLSVTTNSYRSDDIYAFSIYIAPLHVYGSREQYRYTQSSFGFKKGDLREIRNKKSSVCSGAYFYKGERDGVVLFERNKLYYLGCPYISYVELIAVSADVDAAHDIAEGRYDIAEAELDSTLISSLGSINGSSELEGDAVSFASRGRDLYCYVGFNTQRVGVTGEDAQSVALRRAIGILLWYYAPSSVSGFLGDSAGGAYYPIADSNKISVISEIYGKNAEGNDIYTANMSAGDSASAASKAALGYLSAAGFTLDRRGKKVESAPAGARLEYDFLICTQTEVGAAIHSAVKDTAQALDKIGITLNIVELDSDTQLLSALSEGRADMWAYGYRIDGEPDVEGMYYSYTDTDDPVEAGRNYSRISDTSINEKIMDIRSSDSIEQRMKRYKECFDLVYSLCAELPLYAKDRVTLVSSERSAKDSVLVSLTDHYDWTDTVGKIKLN